MSEDTPRITKVSTRNGDAGQTRLGNNQRISKMDPLVRALGSTDELNSAVGLLRCYLSDEKLDELLAERAISLQKGINKLLTGGINSEITVAFH